MNSYRINWSIDIEADNPEDAAIQAHMIQCDPCSIATVFQVTDAATGETVDIDRGPMAIDG